MTLPAVGLTTREAARRLGVHGPNTVPEPDAPSPLRRLLRSLRDPLVLVLLAALVLALLNGDVENAAVIALVVVTNSVIGLNQEIRADNAVVALSRMVATRAWVERSGQVQEVPLADLVPGDLVLVRAGDLVPADGVLVDGAGLEVDESSLTGESVPVSKQAGDDPGPGAGEGPARAAEVPTRSALHAGTVVLHGRGRLRVTATGAQSSVGRIAGLLGGAPTSTPLQRRMATLSGQLAVAAVALSSIVLVVGLVQGQPIELMAVTTIALVVAAVPESLPLVVTVALALAARRMARRHAVVRGLAAVETLGSVTLLATDKTGTMTEGSMSVTRTWTPPGTSRTELLVGLALCNDATRDEHTGRHHGDPTESALLQAAADGGVDVAAVRAAHQRVAETPFDSTRKSMTTTHRTPEGECQQWHKGAPEAILRPGSLADPADLLEEARVVAADWAADGTRVMAVARGLDGNRRLLGLVGLADPVRSTSAHTVASCRDAGIRVVLITGDHPATASSIAAQVGIDDTVPPVSLDGAGEAADRIGRTRAQRATVVARATPADKHALVTAYQSTGEVVAMTGDGVNDGPALRRADIGVAMGRRGTEVARQAADLVLMDDNLGTVVAAVEEGRRVYDNIRRFLVYGLAGGASEVLLMLAGPAVGVALPMLPAQILWLNLLTHTFAGAGLAGEPADPAVLRRGPRPPDEGPLARGLWWRMLALAVTLAATATAVLVASPTDERRTAALLALGAGQLAVAWALRSAGRGTDVPAGDTGTADPDEPAAGSGRTLLPLLGVAVAMLLAAALVPWLRGLLGTVVPGTSTWLLAVASALVVYVVARLLRVHRV